MLQKAVDGAANQHNSILAYVFACQQLHTVATARTGMSTPVCLTSPAVFFMVQEMLHLGQYQESDTG